MKLIELTTKIEVWDSWVNAYKNFVPKFIIEASTKENWKDWDSEVFVEYFEKSNNQCVSSLQQGYFTKDEQAKIKNNWSELAPLLKKVADNQEEPQWDTYQQIKRTIRKFTTQNRKASTYRLIAGLQPNILCTIVKDDSLKELFKFINKNIEEDLPKYHNNWFKDSHAINTFYKKHNPSKNYMDLISYPWQSLEEFKARNQKRMKVDDLIKVYKKNILTTNWLDDELYKFEWANWLAKKIHFLSQSEKEILAICLASQEEKYSTSKGVQFIKQGAREKLSKFIGIEDVKIFKDFYSGMDLEELDCSQRNMSFPILSCYLSVFTPELVMPASKTNFANICRSLFDAKLSNSGMNFVIGIQPYMEEIKDKLYDQKEILSSLKSKLDKSELSELDMNWLTQDFLLYLDKNQNLIEPATEIQNLIKIIEMPNKQPLNQILYGPPGTGKTYQTITKALSIIVPGFYKDNINERIALTDKFKELTISNWSDTKGQIAFCTFHQSFTYEDFVEGIKPKVVNDKDIIYEVQKGIFKAICDRARTATNNSIDFDTVINKLQNKILNDGIITLTTDRGNKFDVNYTGQTTFRIRPHESTVENPQYPASIENIRMLYEGAPLTDLYNPSYVKGILEYLYGEFDLPVYEEVKDNDKPYVIIIDEINRGNVASIFGELITLIEPDKRSGEDEELSVILPYSKKEFKVPNNVYIIGTMNTADRSVEALDSALRRRFSFEEVMPDDEVITEVLKDKDNWEDTTISIILKKINKRVTRLIDRDHQIGHSYFLKIKNLEKSEITNALKNIFSENIIPLLQEYFFNDFNKLGLVLGEDFLSKEDKDENIFAKFTEGDDGDYTDAVYEIRDPKDMKDDEFINAIKGLLN